LSERGFTSSGREPIYQITEADTKNINGAAVVHKCMGKYEEKCLLCGRKQLLSHQRNVFLDHPHQVVVELELVPLATHVIYQPTRSLGGGGGGGGGTKAI